MVNNNMKRSPCNGVIGKGIYFSLIDAVWPLQYRQNHYNKTLLFSKDILPCFKKAKDY